MTNLIIGQILGIIATAITFLSYQANTKKWVLIIQTSATAFTCLSYFFLGASSGLILNVVCILRNIVFFFQKEKMLSNYVWSGIFTVAMVVLGIFSWQAWFSIFLIIALAANTVFLSLGNPQLLRKSILATSSLVIIYNLFVFSIGGLANEALAIISSIIGIIRFRKTKNSSEADAPSEEI